MAAADPIHGEARELQLQQGRTLTLAPEDSDEVVEIRSSSGLLELRIRVTEEGPVLEMESIRLSLRASESVDVDCKDFNVNAKRSVGLSSEGEIRVSGKADVLVGADGEIHVKGEKIYLN